MNITTIWTTDINPSHTGMSFAGASARTRVTTHACVAQAAVIGRLGKREASYPGTTAWRPPTW